MKSSVAVSLAGLAIIFAQCIAMPLPMAPNGGKPSSSKPAKALSSREAIKNHGKVMDTGRQVMENVARDKSASLSFATALRREGAPVFHQYSLDQTEMAKTEGLVGYNNRNYAHSVQAVKDHGPILKATHAQVKDHLKALESHDKPLEVVDMRQEAQQMSKSMKKAKPWIKHHLEDEGAEDEVRKIINSGIRLLKAPAKSRPTDDIEKKMIEVNEVLDSVPKAKPLSPAELALRKHDRVWKETSDLVHGAVDRKQAVLHHEEILRKKGHPVIHSKAFGVTGYYDNVNFKNAVDELTAHGAKISARLAPTQQHAEALKSHKGKESKQAEQAYTALMSAHEIVKPPREDPNGIREVDHSWMTTTPLQPRPTSTKYIEEQRKAAEHVRKMIPKNKEQSKESQESKGKALMQ